MRARQLETATPSSIGWAISDGPVDYAHAVAAMEAHVEAIAAGRAGELVWLLEHPPIYTAGTSARSADLLAPARFPVHATGRGGQFTYHGPGQRVAYVMLDVRRRSGGGEAGNVRAFVSALEGWIVDALAAFNVRGETRPDRVGVWVRRTALGENREDKIAALGIRLRRWVSFHGVSINVDPDLTHFAGIVPCGITAGGSSPYGITSLVDLGLPVSMADVDVAMRASFEQRFGATEAALPPLPQIHPARQ